MFNNRERILNFGKKTELPPAEVLHRAYALGGVEYELIETYLTERSRIYQQAEVGGGMIAQDRLLLDTLAEETVIGLREHGISVTATDLESFEPESA